MNDCVICAYFKRRASESAFAMYGHVTFVYRKKANQPWLDNNAIYNKYQALKHFTEVHMQLTKLLATFGNIHPTSVAHFVETN